MQKAIIHERDYDNASAVIGFEPNIEWREGSFVTVRLSNDDIDAIARACIWVEE